MGFLRFLSLHSSSLPREQWGQAALGISLAFQPSRLELYKLSVDKLTNSFYRGRELPGLNFSDDIQGLKIKAFQLYLATHLIATKEYISPKMGKEFADLLWAQVFGNQLIEGIAQAKAFTPESGTYPRIYKFFGLLAADITGKLNPADGMLLLELLGPKFAEDCYRAVATSFMQPNVERLVQHERSQVEQHIAEMKQRFFQKFDDIAKP